MCVWSSHSLVLFFSRLHSIGPKEWLMKKNIKKTETNDCCSTCSVRRSDAGDICSVVNNSLIACVCVCVHMCNGDHRSNVYLSAQIRRRIMNYWSNQTMKKKKTNERMDKLFFSSPCLSLSLSLSLCLSLLTYSESIVIILIREINIHISYLPTKTRRHAACVCVHAFVRMMSFSFFLSRLRIR